MRETVPSGLLLRVLLAAALFSGLMLAAFNLTVSDRFVDRAIEWEEQQAAETGAHEDVFTRREQKVGLVVGEIFFAAMVVAVFAGVFALTYDDLPGATGRAKAAILAAIGFVAAFAVPFLKYPARPPGVGDPDTVYERQALYLAVLALSVVAAIIAVRLWNHRRELPWRSAVLGGYGVWAAALLLVFPGNPDPIGAFPDRLLLEFQLSTVAGQIVFWAALAFSFGYFLERFAGREPTAALEPAD